MAEGNFTAPGSDVSTPSGVYQAQSLMWHLPRALMGGTRQMRHEGPKYLPKDEAELPKAYEARITRSVLFNAFRKTVKDMTGKVFAKEIVLGDDVPEPIKDACENIDLAGRHLNVFARDVFFDSMPVGIGYILVDMPPPVTREDGTPATVADEKAAGLRPYMNYVKAEDLIGWQSDTINGAETLTQVRIMEHPLVADGPYNEKCIEQIRVLKLGAWETWRKSTTADNRDQWCLFETGLSSVTDKITLTPVYLNRTGFMTAEPPLEDLADLNVAHWQSQSDQRNILHVARVPILFAAGFADDAPIAIGANTCVRNSNAEAKLTFVEHTGAAISAGGDDLKNLEFQMQTQGLQLIVSSPGGQTATGEVLDVERENSPLAMMANALGDALEIAFGFMAEYMNITLPANTDTDKDSGGSVTVNTDYGASLDAADLQLLLNMVNGGSLSKASFWAELKRRDVLMASFDAEKEQALLDEEAPTLTAANPMNLGGGAPGAAPPVKAATLPGGGNNGPDALASDVEANS